LVSGAASSAWLYVAGPLLGSGLAVLIMVCLHQQRDPKEYEAADGDEEQA